MAIWIEEDASNTALKSLEDVHLERAGKPLNYKEKRSQFGIA